MPDDADIRRLAGRVSPGGTPTDLGGWTGRNLWLRHPGGSTPGGERDLVLHVHPRYVSRRRMSALQRFRRALFEQGLAVPTPIRFEGSTILECACSLAELEPYLPNEQPPRTWASYACLLHATGRFHRASATVDVDLPKPAHTVYAAPSTLHRWAAASRARVQPDPVAEELGCWLESLTTRVRHDRLVMTELPTLNVHGDIKPENVRQGPGGDPVYLDFGFSACRPRIHDLAFTLTHTVLTVNGDDDPEPVDPETFEWDRIPALMAAYQQGAGWRLTTAERVALAPYTAAVRLYWAASVWLHEHDSEARPAARLRNQAGALRLAYWLLRHPDALMP